VLVSEHVQKVAKEEEERTRAMSAVPIGLFAPSALSLDEAGGLHAEVPPRMAGDSGGWMVATFHAETSEDVHSDYWEAHPSGEEAVCVLAGAARVILRAGDGADEQAVTLPARTAYIVPRGRWHRLEVDGPTDLMSITPRLGTRHTRRE
jgi:mannose-6-phosphate isomerase-like protein (cupin superfamily)